MIVSVHLPKTAGTSFAAALERTFGESLLRDYADFPINTPPYERNKSAIQDCLANAEKDYCDIECIHGHFLPVKYLLLAQKRPVHFVTWVRNPVERVVSHYYSWQRSFNPEDAQPLHRRVIEEKWPLDRFCLAPEVRNLYSQFLWGFPPEYFAFIGVTEFFHEDFAAFASRFMEAGMEPERLNVGNPAGDGYEVPDSLRSDIEQFHAKDMELYHRALEKRPTKPSY